MCQHVRFSLAPAWLATLLWLFAPAPLNATPSLAGPAVGVLPVSPLDSVFHIEKSENRNQVHYGVKVDPACRPVGPQPVYGYWRDLERGPSATSPLLSHELVAYGLNEPRSIQLNPGGGRIRISLRGFPERPLFIDTLRQSSGCVARAQTSIGGQMAVLQSIYVKIGFLFSVDYAMLRGLRVSDRRQVQEKVHD
jgi:hypothetical protein